MRTGLLNGRAHLRLLVGGEIVEHDDVAPVAGCLFALVIVSMVRSLLVIFTCVSG